MILFYIRLSDFTGFLEVKAYLHFINFQVTRGVNPHVDLENCQFVFKANAIAPLLHLSNSNF